MRNLIGFNDFSASTGIDFDTPMSFFNGRYYQRFSSVNTDVPVQQIPFYIYDNPQPTEEEQELFPAGHWEYAPWEYFVTDSVLEYDPQTIPAAGVILFPTIITQTVQTFNAPALAGPDQASPDAAPPPAPPVAVGGLPVTANPRFFVAVGLSYKVAPFAPVSQTLNSFGDVIGVTVSGSSISGEQQTFVAEVDDPIDYEAFTATLLTALQWNAGARTFSNGAVNSVWQMEVSGNDAVFFFNDAFFYIRGGFIGFQESDLPTQAQFDGKVFSSGIGGGGTVLGVNGSGVFFQPPDSTLAFLNANNAMWLQMFEAFITGPYTITGYTIMASGSTATGFNLTLTEPVLIRHGNATGRVMVPPPGVGVASPDTTSESWTYGPFPWGFAQSDYHSLNFFPVGRVNVITQP